MMQEAHRLGQMSTANCARMANAPIVKLSGLLKNRALNSSEVIALTQICAADTSPEGERCGDRCYFVWLWPAALGIGES